MRYTQYTLLHNGLKALPAVATMGGGAAAVFLIGMGVVEVDGEKLGQHIVLDIIICGVWGLLGGLAVSGLGQAALYHVNVEDDPRYKEKRPANSGMGGPSKATKVYTKSDLEDHVRTIAKVQKKHQEKEKADKAERAQILEMGTEGLERKRKEKLGIKGPGVSKPVTRK